VQQGEVLVGEEATVDGLSAGTIAGRNVTTLTHELRNDAVEAAALVVQRLAKFALATLAGGESTKVFGSLGTRVAEQLKLDATCGCTVNRNVKEDAGALSHKLLGRLAALVASKAGDHLLEAAARGRQRAGASTVGFRSANLARVNDDNRRRRLPLG